MNKQFYTELFIGEQMRVPILETEENEPFLHCAGSEIVKL